MKIERKFMLTAIAFALLLMPLGIAASLPDAAAVSPGESSVLSADYDFENRNSPTNLLIYTEYADLTPTGEYANIMGAIADEYGETNYLQIKKPAFLLISKQ